MSFSHIIADVEMSGAFKVKAICFKCFFHPLPRNGDLIRLEDLVDLYKFLDEL
jgi:hypothetical protein